MTLAPLNRLVSTWRDPLRNPHTATKWIDGLPESDILQVQAKALELVGTFPGSRSIAPSHAEALLRIDARLEPVIDGLTRQYTANYQRSSGIETRLWHAVFDLVKAFGGAYQAMLKAGYPVCDQPRWRALLPKLLVRLTYYKGQDAKYRLFRYGHWIPAKWREFHEIYELARMRGWQREPLSFQLNGVGRPSTSVEQEYLKTLLLQRLDSGSFTPDQVDWVARQIAHWAPPLILSPPPGMAATFFVDLAGSQGLCRQEQTQNGGRKLFLDASPIYANIVERMRWLPEQVEDPPRPGELPPREERLLLMRLAALYGPDALAFSPRAPREASDAVVRVVTGIHPITRAVAEVVNLPDTVKSIVPAHAFDEVTELATPIGNTETLAKKARGMMWRIVDVSDSGYRMVAPAAEVPTRMGELVAIREAHGWALGAVRRMQRVHVDELTCGVEIIGRRMVRVLLRTRPSHAGSDGARPFYGLYLPAHADNQQAAQRSLIGPDDRCLPGAMIELDTGGATYLIRFTRTLERQQGWAWGLFDAVRKLTQ